MRFHSRQLSLHKPSSQVSRIHLFLPPPACMYHMWPEYKLFIAQWAQYSQFCSPSFFRILKFVSLKRTNEQKTTTTTTTKAVPIAEIMSRNPDFHAKFDASTTRTRTECVVLYLVVVYKIWQFSYRTRSACMVPEHFFYRFPRGKTLATLKVHSWSIFNNNKKWATRSSRFFIRILYGGP